MRAFLPYTRMDAPNCARNAVVRLTLRSLAHWLLSIHHRSMRRCLFRRSTYRKLPTISEPFSIHLDPALQRADTGWRADLGRAPL
jgi:hypothetical protein